MPSAFFTASYKLLEHVAGIGPSLARKIVDYREINGFLKSRESLKLINGYGDKAFEQSGFFRNMSSKYD